MDDPVPNRHCGGSRRRNCSRTRLSRIAFLTALFVTAAVCGSVAYWLVSDLRRSAAEAAYESLAATAVANAVNITQRKVRGGDVLTSVLRHAFPRPEQWPLVHLPGFEETARQVAAQSSSTTALGLVAVVRPAQVEAFEAMALQVYDAYGYAAGAGVYDPPTSSFGIFANGANGTRHRDADGRTSWGSNRTVLTPIFQRSNQNARGLLLNVHAEPFRGRAIDSIFQCTDDANANANAANNANTTELPSCGVVTDFIELFVAPGRPAALLYQPVYVTNSTNNTSNDSSSNTALVSMVAMIGHSIFWEEVLRDVVPTYVSDLQCVLTSTVRSEQPPRPPRSFTYVLEDGGVPRLLGPGDLHDARFDRWARTAVLTRGHVTGAAASAIYALTVYPTAAFFAELPPPHPRAVALGLVAVIAFCAVLFFVYDAYVQSEAHQRRRILQVKRRFVRFVSHEIRTPLNTVCMGLELIRTELQDLTTPPNNNNNNTTTKRSGGQDSATCSTTESSTADTMITDGLLAPPPPLLEAQSVATLVYVDQQAKEERSSASPTAAAASQPSSSSVSDSGGAPDNNNHELIVSSLRELAGEVADNANSAVLLLNDLLNYDKIESGTLKLEIGIVSMWKVLRTTVSQFQIQAKAKNVTLSFGMESASDASESAGEMVNEAAAAATDVEAAVTEPDLSHLKLVGDDVRLGQVLRNLISNALKFTPESGCVDVRASHLPHGLPQAKTLSFPEEKGVFLPPRGGSVRITVKDTGAGMSPDQLAMLFHEGVQFDANKLQAGGGSGLGLFIAKGIIEQHGGTVRADSQGQGNGSTFTVELPLYCFPVERLTGEASERDTTSLPDAQSADLRAMPRTILVVDDALMNRKILIRLLERQGHTCHPATNGLEAVEMYKADPTFDTILMDYEMPVMDGPTATQQLRDLGCQAHIIGVTGNVLADDVAYFKSHGADHVLPKPVDLSRLRDCWASR